MTKLPFTLPDYMHYKEDLTLKSLSRPEKQIQRNVEYIFALMNIAKIKPWSTVPYIANESYVNHNSKIWRANTSNQNSEPTDVNTDWTMIVDLTTLSGDIIPIPGYSFTVRTKVPEITVSTVSADVILPAGFTYSVGKNQLEVFVDVLS